MADVPKLPKRPDYFQAQFLVVRDFQDEQTYHAEMLWRHNRGLHEWGVLRDGLQVSMTGDKKNLSISPGSAIDSLGREIVLEADQLLSIDQVTSQFNKGLSSPQDVFITISFNEVDSDKPEDKYPGTDHVTRQMQSPTIAATESPATDGSVITLARVSVTSSNEVGQPDNSARKAASSFIARGSNLGDISLDGALSFTSKSSPNPTYPQVGLDYDLGGDALRIRARTQNAPALDTTYVAIKRDTGNVGIGSVQPLAKLEIQGGATSEGANDPKAIAFSYGPGGYRHWIRTRHNDTTGGSGNAIDFYVNDDATSAGSTGPGTGSVHVMTLDSGRVGIGTTSPGAKLSVVGDPATVNIETKEFVRLLRPVVTGVKNQNSAGFLVGAFEEGLVGRSRLDIALAGRPTATNEFGGLPDTTVMSMLANGNVGIGTVAPGARLQILDTPVDAASYSFSNWNGTGNAVSAFIKTATHNGGHTLADTQPALVLGREGVPKQSWPNFAEFKIGRYEDSGTSARSRLDIALTHGDEDAAGTNVMTMLSSGNVGIGTISPTKGKLEISGSVTTTTSAYGYCVNREHDFAGFAKAEFANPYSVWASDKIAALEFDALSDARIKSILGRSDSATDLLTLLGIEITDYRYKDVIGKGNDTYKKVIGQQVEKVFPQAVSKHTDVVPDIYRQASIRDGWVALATELKRGDRVKLITEKGEEGVHEVLEVTPDKFRVDFKHEEDKVFVFGREVKDFLTVDYDAIAMLNVSATQQLKKENDEAVKALRTEIAELKAANDALGERLQLLESKTETVPNLAAGKRGSNGNASH